MDNVVDAALMGEFISAFNRNDEEEAMRLLNTEGFVTPDNLGEWSTAFLRERAQFDGVDVWKIANAVIDIVGETPDVWNPHHHRGCPVPSDKWMGYAVSMSSTTYELTADILTVAVFFHRLAPACFSLAGLLSTRVGGGGYVGCHDAAWAHMTATIGMPPERPNDAHAYARAALDAILEDYPTLAARIEAEDFVYALVQLQARLCWVCSPAVLHENAPDSIAARLFAGNPLVFILELRRQPSLLESHRFTAPPRTLFEVLVNLDGFRGAGDEECDRTYEALIRVADEESIRGLDELVRELSAHDVDEIIEDSGMTRACWDKRVAFLRMLCVGSRTKAAC